MAAHPLHVGVRLRRLVREFEKSLVEVNGLLASLELPLRLPLWSTQQRDAEAASDRADLQLWLDTLSSSGASSASKSASAAAAVSPDAAQTLRPLLSRIAALSSQKLQLLVAPADSASAGGSPSAAGEAKSAARLQQQQQPWPERCPEFTLQQLSIDVSSADSVIGHGSGGVVHIGEVAELTGNRQPVALRVLPAFGFASAAAAAADGESAAGAAASAAAAGSKTETKLVSAGAGSTGSSALVGLAQVSGDSAAFSAAAALHWRVNGHPNLVRCFGVVREPRAFVLEYCTAATLDEHLYSRTPLQGMPPLLRERTVVGAETKAGAAAAAGTRSPSGSLSGGGAGAAVDKYVPPMLARGDSTRAMPALTRGDSARAIPPALLTRGDSTRSMSPARDAVSAAAAAAAALAAAGTPGPLNSAWKPLEVPLAQRVEWCTQLLSAAQFLHRQRLHCAFPAGDPAAWSSRLRSHSVLMTLATSLDAFSSVSMSPTARRMSSVSVSGGASSAVAAAALASSRLIPKLSDFALPRSGRGASIGPAAASPSSPKAPGSPALDADPHATSAGGPAAALGWVRWTAPELRSLRHASAGRHPCCRFIVAVSRMHAACCR